MDTKLINSQLISRKDVRVWFWDGEREYKGRCVETAENGIVFRAALKTPGAGTLVDASAALPGIKRLLEGKKVMVELSSPKVKGEVKLRFLKIGPVAGEAGLFEVEALYETPPNPRFLKLLFEPVVVRKPRG